jgi:hypothetical protein
LKHATHCHPSDIVIRPTTLFRNRAYFQNEKPACQRAFVRLCHFEKSGAGEGIRTLDPDLGKVVLYH